MKNGWNARILWYVCWLLVTSGFADLANAQQSDSLVRRSGKHIRLTTDLPATAQLDRLVSSFDAAVPLWAKFWNLPSGALDDWGVEAYVMQDIATFQRLDLIDPRVPEFPNAYALANQVWVRVQPSEYYTQHLLLHEGVHSLVFHQFGDTGPTWFREGIAELLATHSGSGVDLRINQIPVSRQASPYWGRFKRMDQQRSEGNVPRIETVLQYEANLRGDVDAYGWSWALVSMLDAYPKYRETLLQAAQHGCDTDRQFNQWLTQRLANDWPIVQARWRNLVEDFHYGFDWERQRIQISKQDPMWDGTPIEIQIEADRGWQSIGVRLNRGMTCDVVADGTVIVDDDPKPWVSGPDGVTVEYHNGQPLGRLQARIVPNIAPGGHDSGSDSLLPLVTIAVGKAATIMIDQPCWLLLRVNDAVGSLDDNQSAYRVSITRGIKPSR
jgi:hypothetical protein